MAWILLTLIQVSDISYMPQKTISGWWFQTCNVRSPTAGFVRHDKSVDKSVVSNMCYFHPYLGR